MPKISPSQGREPSNQDFKALAESIPNLAWMADADGWLFWYNPRWYEYTGKTPKEMEGWGWQSVHDPKLLPAVLERWEASIATGRSFDMEFPLRSAAGELRWFLTRVMPFRDERGRVIRWFGTNTDIHELRRTQDALRESERRLLLNEERFRFTQRAAKIASWELDLDQDIYIFTPEVFELLGQDRSTFNPTQANLLSLMFISSDRDNVRGALKKAMIRKKEYSAQFRIRRPDGDVRWVAAKGTTFFNQGKNLLLGVFIDITEAQQALLSQNNLATEYASRRK